MLDDKLVARSAYESKARVQSLDVRDVAGKAIEEGAFRREGEGTQAFREQVACSHGIILVALPRYGKALEKAGRVVYSRCDNETIRQLRNNRFQRGPGSSLSRPYQEAD